MKIRSFREITLISFRDVTSKAFSWKRSICLWQTFREIRVWSQGLVQKRKAIVKKSFCSLTLLFCKHINESTLWSASNNILWPWYSEILEFSEAERFTLISRNILRQNYSSHLNFYSIFTLFKSNNRMNCFKKQLRYNFPETYSNVCNILAWGYKTIMPSHSSQSPSWKGLPNQIWEMKDAYSSFSCADWERVSLCNVLGANKACIGNYKAANGELHEAVTCIRGNTLRFKDVSLQGLKDTFQCLKNLYGNLTFEKNIS